jgi:HlyD family secretion protein
MSGTVTRLAVEEGEVAVPGTFSRETGLLLTISDLTVIQTVVQVDETDVVRISEGDSVSINIDAYPDTSFTGRVMQISQSAIQASLGQAGGDRAVDFEVKITLDTPPEGIRPDLSATARIVTDVREEALALPIIALTVREHEDLPSELSPADSATANGESKKTEREGVFVVEGGLATFRPVRVGIAGDEHFEVLEGLAEGDSIVAGPYQAVRDLRDKSPVRASGDGAGGTGGSR